MGLTEKSSGGMDRLRQRVQNVGTPAFRAEVNQVLAAAALKQVADEYVESRDPYGKPWQALTSRDGQPLRNRGLQAASAHADQRPDGFAVVIDQGHPAVHNRGAVIVPVAAAALRFVVRGAVVFARKVVIPKRQIVPDRQRGLGPIWGKGLGDQASDLMRRALGKATP